MKILGAVTIKHNFLLVHVKVRPNLGRRTALGPSVERHSHTTYAEIILVVRRMWRSGDPGSKTNMGFMLTKTGYMKQRASHEPKLAEKKVQTDQQGLENERPGG